MRILLTITLLLPATALAAWTVFALLTGLGTWLVGSPAPAWFPWRGVWIAVLLVSASAVVPLWWRLGRVGANEGTEEAPEVR